MIIIKKGMCLSKLEEVVECSNYMISGLCCKTELCK